MTWLPSPPEEDLNTAFSLYWEAVTTNAGGQFPDYADLQRFVVNQPPEAQANINALLQSLVQRGWLEHQRWLDA